MTVWLRLEEHEARLLIDATRNEAHSFSATAQDAQAARCRALADRLERKSLSARPLAYRAALASVEYETEPAT